MTYRFLLIGSQFAEAWAGLQLWRWFAVPLGVPMVGYWHFVGINILFSVIGWRFLGRPKLDTAGAVKECLSEHLSMWGSALVLGWLVSFGM